MTFREYFTQNEGHFIAIDSTQSQILILNQSKIIVKELFVSNSLKRIHLHFDALFDTYMNDHNLDTELKIMEGGHEGKDWLFFSQHVAVL